MRKTYIKMTDEQFIQWLWKIKFHCCATACDNCEFRLKDTYENNYIATNCQIKAIAKMIDIAPCRWDIEETERIIRL